MSIGPRLTPGFARLKELFSKEASVKTTTSDNQQICVAAWFAHRLNLTKVRHMKNAPKELSELGIVELHQYGVMW